MAFGDHLFDKLLSVYTVEGFLKVYAQEVDKFTIIWVLNVSSLLGGSILSASKERAQIVHVRGGRLAWPKATLIWV